MRWLVLLIVFVLAGCDNDKSPPLPPASPWNILYSPAMPPYMVPEGGNYVFDFPNPPGSVHYVTRQVAGDGRRSIRMQFRIDGDGQFVPTEGDPPARIRLYLQRVGDNLSGAGEFEHYRFWSAPTDLARGEFVMEYDLNPALWTSVYGKHDDAGFAALLANLGSAGFTFGGTFAGHGVYVNGSAKFVLISYQIN